MLSQEIVDQIRHLYFKENTFIKAISRDLNLSRNTVRKVLRSKKTTWSHSPRRPYYRALGGFIDLLEQWLGAAHQKQSDGRVTMVQLYRDLQNQGYEGATRRCSGIVNAGVFSTQRPHCPRQLRAVDPS